MFIASSLSTSARNASSSSGDMELSESSRGILLTGSAPALPPRELDMAGGEEEGGNKVKTGGGNHVAVLYRVGTNRQ